MQKLSETEGSVLALLLYKKAIRWIADRIYLFSLNTCFSETKNMISAIAISI